MTICNRLNLGHSYFNLDGRENTNNYLDRFLYDLEKIKGKNDLSNWQYLQ